MANFILQFAKKKKSTLGVDKIYEQDNIDKYKEFKELVLSRIVRMVSDPKDIMLAVHSTLVDFLDEYDMVGWVRANDSEVNTALLTQVNELSIENKQLIKKSNMLSQKINSMQDTFESDLAFEGEEVIIQATYSEKSKSMSPIYHDRNIEKSITWDKMFLLWAPRLTVTLNCRKSKSELEYALKDYMGRYIKLNDNQFHTIKIQYSALGLIKYYEARTTQGGTAEFINLTSKGREYMVKKSAIRRN
ncbi:hypothetical protein [Lactococcus cremoris]|uniref:hypothetical protein n=1 Tax=Lactococcus lactis subsp. cremoris TaxID=1359 RepID=UPI0007AE93A7|nr:hypothetical protein [Lactococcus cremoris]KZK47608.1 hypothetical protein FG2_1164 [Lactococcus cremoris]